MIIETTDNRFFDVWETRAAGLDHVWYGYEMKRIKDGFILTARGLKEAKRCRPQLVRKEASRVVEA